MKAFFRILLLTTTVLVIALLPFFTERLAVVRVAKQEPVTQVAKQEPVEDLKLTAPDVIEIGELARLDLSESTAIGIKWLVVPETVDFEVIDGGKRALFSSRVGGTYRFVIAGARGDIASIVHHEITVTGGTPGPSPGPGPAVAPLDQSIVNWAKLVKDYPAKKQHAAGIAAVFRKLADAPDVKVEQILEATALANSAVLGADLEKWVAFLDAMGTELDARVAANTLSTREQYREAWLQIATGLERIAK